MQEARNMSAAERIMDIVSARSNAASLKMFDGFLPVDLDLLMGFATKWGFLTFADVTPDTLDGPLNVSAFNYARDEYPDMCLRARKADPKTIRKMTNVFSASAYVVECYHFDTGFRNTVPVEVRRNEKFRDARIIVPHGYVVNGKTEEEAAKSIATLAGVQFLLENCCHVYLKPDDAVIGFRLPLTSLSEAKEIFKMREVEPGKKRRAALRHFVAEHYRKLPSDPNEMVKIARYLRGASCFKWNGFECTFNIPKSLTDVKTE